MQQLNRQASLESSFNQQAAAYGAQGSQMIGQAVGAIGSFAAQGGFKQGAFQNPNTTSNTATNKDLLDLGMDQGDIDNMYAGFRAFNIGGV
jgi:hypothetical protein